MYPKCIWKKQRFNVLAAALSVAALLLPGSAFAQGGMSSGSGPGSGSGPNFLDEDQQFELVAEGVGWKELRQADATQRVTPDSTIIAVWPEGVDNAPLPASTKTELRDDFGITGGISGQASSTSSLDAMFVDRKLAEAIANGDSLATWSAYGESSEGRSCGWKMKTQSENWSFDELNDESTFTLLGLNGTLDVDIPLNGTANVDLQYEYKTQWFLGLCVPYKVRFKQARIWGNVDILGSSDLSASFALGGSWNGQHQVMEPKLGAVDFWVGPLWVNLKFTLPVDIGYELEAQLQGNVDVSTDFGVQGVFDYTCTRNDCTGNSNFAKSFNTNDDLVTASIELDVEAQVYARVMVKASLYHESIAWAAAGVKGYVQGDLWGYYGNTCGDADGDGSNETVEALTLEATAGYDWAFGLGGFTHTRYWDATGGSFYLGYWDLLGEGGSTALSGMIVGPSEVAVGDDASYQISLRPCYPFTEDVLFDMRPGTWSGELINISKGQTKTVTRSFANTGTKNLRVKLASDSQGRAINTEVSRDLDVIQPIPPAALELSFVPDGGGARTTFRNESPGQPSTVFFSFDQGQGGFENRPGGACANGSNNPTYIKLSYDGPTVASCRFQTHFNQTFTACSAQLVSDFNAGTEITINTDSYQTNPGTCQLESPAVTVCGPNQYCWTEVEFTLTDGTVLSRSMAYRKYL